MVCIASLWSAVDSSAAACSTVLSTPRNATWLAAWYALAASLGIRLWTGAREARELVKHKMTKAACCIIVGLLEA